MLIQATSLKVIHGTKYPWQLKKYIVLLSVSPSTPSISLSFSPFEIVLTAFECLLKNQIPFRPELMFVLC